MKEREARQGGERGERGWGLLSPGLLLISVDLEQAVGSI